MTMTTHRLATPLMASLIDEGLDLFAADYTDASGRRNEQDLGRQVTHWLQTQHFDELHACYEPVLLAEIAQALKGRRAKRLNATVERPPALDFHRALR